MALHLEKDVKFVCSSTHQEGCSLWVIVNDKGVSEIGCKVVTPDALLCGS